MGVRLRNLDFDPYPLQPTGSVDASGDILNINLYWPVTYAKVTITTNYRNVSVKPSVFNFGRISARNREPIEFKIETAGAPVGLITLGINLEWTTERAWWWGTRLIDGSWTQLWKRIRCGESTPPPDEEPLLPPRDETMEICVGDPIPEGFIVVNDKYDAFKCGGGAWIGPTINNVLVTKRYDHMEVGDDMWVCIDAPTPYGWEEVSWMWQPLLCGQPTMIYNNTKKIRKVDKPSAQILMQELAGSFIGNSNTLEIHREDCSWVSKIHEPHRFSIEAAEVEKVIIEKGYDGCYYCFRSRHWK